MTREQRIVEQARSMLTPLDLKVAELGFRYIEDMEEGYGRFWDGQESEIVQAQAWLMQQVAGCEPASQKIMKSKFEGREYTDERYRRIGPPFGYKSDPLSDQPDFFRDDLEEYQGLNEDDDCALSELLAAVAYAYQFYADGYDYELLDEEGRSTYGQRFRELGLDPVACGNRQAKIVEMYLDARGDKHDRNEKLWC